MNIINFTKGTVKAGLPIKAVTAPVKQAKISYWKTVGYFLNPIPSARHRRAAASNPDILAEMLGSYEAMLARWGVANTPKEINMVKKGLMLEVWLFSLVASIPALDILLDGPAWQYWYSLATLSPTCLFIASARLWKYECINNQQFMQYKDWWIKQW